MSAITRGRPKRDETDDKNPKLPQKKKLYKYLELRSGLHLNMEVLRNDRYENILPRAITPIRDFALTESNLRDNMGIKTKKNYRQFKSIYTREAYHTLVSNLVESFYLILALKVVDARKLEDINKEMLEGLIACISDIDEGVETKLNAIGVLGALVNYRCQNERYTYEIDVRRVLKNTNIGQEKIMGIEKYLNPFGPGTDDSQGPTIVELEAQYPGITKRAVERHLKFSSNKSFKEVVEEERMKYLIAENEKEV